MGKHNRKRPTTAAYYGLEAEAYGSSQWMARNQIRTTQMAIQLLDSEQLGPPKETPPEEILILDIGCGTGYSTAAIVNAGFNTVGIEISRDMLTQIKEKNEQNRIQADMRYMPLRNAVFDAIISISAFNFASAGARSLNDAKILIRAAVSQFERVLKQEGKAVIEFYPTKEEEPLFLAEFKRIGLEGGLMILEPQTKREKKLLLLKKP